MSVNRLGRLFSSPCKCQRIARRLARVNRECKILEMLIGSVAEFMTPSLGSMLEGDRKTIKLYIAFEPNAAKLSDDLRAYAVAELRRAALELSAAADRVEGSNTEGSAVV